MRMLSRTNDALTAGAARSRIGALFFAMCLAVAPSCGDTGRAFVDIPFEARGVSDATFEQDGWEVTLSQAIVGFGPIAFCATELASDEFCETAVLELTASATIDALDPGAQSIGQLSGTTGTVRSTFFDYGITWLLTQPQPQANEGAPLGPAIVRPDQSNFVPSGHSGMFTGTATCTADAATCCPGAGSCPASFTFEANVDVVQAQPGQAAVRGVRTEQEITADPFRLTVGLNPVAWWQTVNFARLAAAAEATGAVTLAVDDPDYSALVIAMTANSVPTFEWQDDQ